MVEDEEIFVLFSRRKYKNIHVSKTKNDVKYDKMWITEAIIDNAHERDIIRGFLFYYLYAFDTFHGCVKERKVGINRDHSDRNLREILTRPLETLNSKT